MQPDQQHGRRFPSLSSLTVRATWFFLVSGFLVVTVQQIHSLRASGVMSSHAASATGAAAMDFRKSSGTLCTVPSVIVLVGIELFYQLLECAEKQPRILLSIPRHYYAS